MATEGVSNLIRPACHILNVQTGFTKVSNLYRHESSIQLTSSVVYTVEPCVDFKSNFMGTDEYFY